MYYKYVTNATSVMTEIVADIALLACGGTIAHCSNSCDKTQSMVLANSIPSGWTLRDTYTDAFGTWPVIGAPDANNRTTKYLALVRLSATQFLSTMYETWNTATHTGTNPANPPGGVIVSLTVSNTIYVYATTTVLYVTVVTGAQGQFLVAEFTREAPYLINSNYPVIVGPACASSTYSNSSAVLCRIKNLAATGDLLNSNKVFTNTACITSLNESELHDENELVYNPIYPLWMTATVLSTNVSGNSNNGMLLGRLLDIFWTTPTKGVNLDELATGTDTYILFANVNTTYSAGQPRFAVKKG